jgi:hypothetical protein
MPLAPDPDVGRREAGGRHRAGDMVMTLVGEAQVQPVSWIGERRSVSPRILVGARGAVMIRRGAFGEACRGAICCSRRITACLSMANCPGKLLINDMTIVQRRDVPVYFHVELGAAILLAEGFSGEYLDTGNRAYFSNSGLALVLHPEFH